MIRAASAKVFHRKSYFSADRGKDIEFDVVVEAHEAGAAEPWLRWIWECKDYTSKVSVDDVEEFWAKLEQVGPGVRGAVVTPIGFQQGAFNYAVARKISLFALQKRLVKMTPFDNRPRTVEMIKFRCHEALLASGKRYSFDDDWDLDMLMQIELRHAGLLH